MESKNLIFLVLGGVLLLVAGSCGTGSGTGGGSDADADAGAEVVEIAERVEGDDEGMCSPERCNGIDDDCDTLVDEDFDLMIDVNNCGSCGFACIVPNGEPACVEGVCALGECNEGWYNINGDPYDGCEYECSPSAGVESKDDGSCDDGLDNDCDGRIDDDDTDCSECVPELCNDEDDDCDTLVDEDFDLRTDPLNCGVCGNVCPIRPHATGICVLGECYLQCEEGYVDGNKDPTDGCESICVPSDEPSEVECNGVDDDCDGLVDEDYVPYSCGTGACQTSSVCIMGEELCIPEEPESPLDALCDGIDNDCDGMVDEDFRPVTCRGVCVEGARCEGGVEVCGPKLEEVDSTCDGLDGDCDGEVDEDYTPYSCGTGVCENYSVCYMGEESCEPLSPWSAEDATCDGNDDDCDGFVDEDYTPYQCGTGLCVNSSVCVGGVESCTPLPPPVSQDLNCDGQDEDCDGMVDDDYRPYSCGVGVCQRDSVCIDGVESCTPGAPTGNDSDCDGLDDNCNGSIDENYTPYRCGVGACERDSVCIGGVESCTPGSPTGDDSDCDGVDDNCNGRIDENYVSYTCGIGPCQRQSTCIDGVESCTPGTPQPEVCDGIDNDCNGTIDNGLEDRYEPNESCSTARTLTAIDDYQRESRDIYGTILPRTDDDWYKITVRDDSDTTRDEFDLEIYWVSRPAGVVFDVYRGSCSSRVCTASTNCYNWYTDFYSGSVGENPCRATNTAGYNICNNDTTTYYIHVYRRTGSAYCAEYHLRVRVNATSTAPGCIHP